MCLLVLFILNFSYKNAESLKYSDEVNKTIFGNLASVQELLMDAKYTLEWNGISDPDDFVDPETNINFKKRVQFTEPDEFLVSEDSKDHADQMYNKLSKEVNQIKRRLEFTEEDEDDHDHNWFGLEKWKETLLRRNVLQFIIHTRHEVGKALRQREPIRNDKRYQLGYLFNRLRRIKTEQVKLLYYLHNRIRHRSRPYGHWFRYYNVYYVDDPFLNHLMIYEKLTAFDVDIKDTINYIKEIYSKKESYDYVDYPPSTGPPRTTTAIVKTTPENYTYPDQGGEMTPPGMPPGMPSGMKMPPGMTMPPGMPTPPGKPMPGMQGAGQFG